MDKRFLTAEWRQLVFANYEIDPAVLRKYVPPKTELDKWSDRCFVSLVGFMFLKTKLLGIPVPFHTNFPEVNLRFYVKYHEQGEWKRGVVFIKEIVPHRALSFVANYFFREKYVTMPMQYTWENGNADGEQRVSYQWKYRGSWNRLEVNAAQSGSCCGHGSKEAFITEHFWGYSSAPGDKTAVYRVAHPSWLIHPVPDYQVSCDFGALYGDAFRCLNKSVPASVFLADGSPVTVFYRRFL